MKLNPFAKKAPSHLAGVKADYQRLQLELSAKESALQAAREDLSSYLQELASEEARFPNRHFRSETESALNRQADAARISIGTLEYAVRDLQREINKLSAIVNAAENLKEAKRTWTALRTMRQGLQSHLRQLEDQSQKLQSRINDEGRFPSFELEVRPSGRAVRTSAEKMFALYKTEAENHPDDFHAWFNLGVAYNAAGDRRRARGAMQKAIELSKN